MDNLEIAGDGFDAGGFGEDSRDNMFGTLGMEERDREGVGPVSPVHKVIRDSINYSLKNKDDFLF